MEHSNICKCITNGNNYDELFDHLLFIHSCWWHLVFPSKDKLDFFPFFYQGNLIWHNVELGMMMNNSSMTMNIVNGAMMKSQWNTTRKKKVNKMLNLCFSMTHVASLCAMAALLLQCESGVDGGGVWALVFWSSLDGFQISLCHFVAEIMVSYNTKCQLNIPIGLRDMRHSSVFSGTRCMYKGLSN